MDAGQRKLLPYEYQLIDALGITKDEYLDFVQYQGIYRDVKQDTSLDVRNWTTVAIVMTVVGALMTTASVIMTSQAKKGQQQEAVSGSGQTNRRSPKFAPRNGFNSQQPLAVYGDPVNLIYANKEIHKDHGGVRAGGSLVWSAVRSFGSSQFVEMLMVLGGGKIGAIDQKLCAFGQTPLRDLISENYWIYFGPGETGPLKNAYQLPDDNNNKKDNPGDPAKVGNPGSNPYRVSFGDGTKQDGFSQAYSPTNANQFGVYSPVPINTEIAIRNDEGDLIRSKGTKLNGGNGVTVVNPNANWSNRLHQYNLGSEIKVLLLKDDPKGFLRIPASEERQGWATAFDSAGIYKLGAAVFKVVATKGNAIDTDMIVTLRCIQPGKGSSVKYEAQRARDVVIPVEDISPAEFKQVRRLALKMLRVDDRIVNDITGQVVTEGTTENTRQVKPRELALLGDLKILKKPKKSIKLGYWTYEKPTKNELRLLLKYKLVKENGTLTEEGKNILNRYADLSEAAKGDIKNNYFYSKALVRVEEASYETISPSSIVDFALKTTIYKNVNGRATEYGSERRNAGYSLHDNGIKFRSSMFTVKFKHSDTGEYTYFPGIFVVRRKADNANYIYLRFLSHMNPKNWQFIFTPVHDVEAEIATNNDLKHSDGVVRFHYIDNNLTDAKITYVAPAKWKYPAETPLSGQSTAGTSLNAEWLKTGYPVLQFAGYTRNPSTQGKFFPPINKTPKGMNEWDLFTTWSDNNVNFSFDNGPEFELLAVTEQTVDHFNNYPSLYQNLSLLGLNMYSGRTISDLRSFTVFITKGKQATLLNGEIGHPCHAPNIFYDTAIDKTDGIGQYSSSTTLDIDRLKESQKFCEKNKLFMEGVISEDKSWRTFWSETAHFSLLEMAKIGGKDALVPAIPFDPSSGAISTAPIQVVALFNQGNILEGSYKEEFIEYGDATQDTLVSAIYREQKDDSINQKETRVFAINKTVEVRYADTNENNLTRTTVDMSDYVSSREQAILVAKHLCATKRYTTKNIEFQTFPTASAVAPGDYIYVELAQNKWDNIFTGVIGPGGALNTAFNNDVPLGPKSFLIYNPNAEKPQNVAAVTASVANNTAPALKNYVGSLFVLGTEVKSKRIFKITEVTLEEEGETTIRATEHAAGTDGVSSINKDILGASSLWLVDGN